MRMASSTALLLMLLALPQSAESQLTGQRTAAGCLRIDGSAPGVSATGRLSLRHYPGPPNYESIATGDADEASFILELPASACIDDGGDFTDPAEPFSTVHVVPNTEAVRRRLRSAIGRRVAVTGEAMAAQTGHHHAPLLIFAERVAVH